MSLRKALRYSDTTNDGDADSVLQAMKFCSVIANVAF